MTVKALGYVGIGSRNVNEWQIFALDVLGVQVGRMSDHHCVHLKLDSASYRISIHSSEQEKLAYLGWDVGNACSLSKIEAALREFGIECGSDETTRKERGVEDLRIAIDPNGFRHELFYGQEYDGPFVSPQGVSQFVAGSAGLGHVALVVPDLAQTRRFVTSCLGLQLSDVILGPPRLEFYRCNMRHHSLALAEVPGKRAIHHLMLEVGTLDDVGKALDRAGDLRYPITRSLGRHTNDLVTSFYMRTPGRLELEYGTGGRRIAAGCVAGSYSRESLWGHRRLGDIAEGAS